MHMKMLSKSLFMWVGAQEEGLGMRLDRRCVLIKFLAGVFLCILRYDLESGPYKINIEVSSLQGVLINLELPF